MKETKNTSEHVKNEERNSAGRFTENKPGNTFKKLAYMGMFLALAMIISYVEVLIPIVPSVPGIKIGLANAFILIILYLMGPKEAWIVNLLRVVLTAILFSNIYALAYSLAGAIFSLLGMTLLYRKEKAFSSIGIGMIGGVLHNTGQILVAVAVTLSPAILSYLPVLLVAGLICGALTGGLARLLIPILKKVISF